VRWCPDGDFLRPVFSASRVQHVSGLHPKFALRPHHVWTYGRHPICSQARKKRTSGPTFTILCGHVEDILRLNKFFPIVDMCLSYEDIARQSCAMVPRWRFLATFLYPVFSASCVHQLSDLHLKFALRPHHVWKYGRHPICGG